MKRLRLSNHRLLTPNGLRKRLKAPIGIDIIHDDRAVRRHDCPCSIQLETYVAFTVQAVVNEKINLAEAGEQLGKASPARTRDVCPSVRITIANGRADLLTPKPVYRRKVDTPQVTVSVSLQRLQNTARGDAMSHAGLDNLLRAQMTNETPDRPRQTGVAVIPPLKALWAGPNPFRFQFAVHLWPYSPELRSCLA